MALYDLADLTTRIRDLLNEASASFWSNTTIYACINEAQRYLAMNYGAQQSIEPLTTTSGNRAVAVTGFYVAHVELSDPSGLPVPLSRSTKAQYGRRALSGQQPQYYYQEGTNIIIDPEPNDTFSLTAYTLIPSTDMALTSSSPSIASVFIPALILLSLAYCFRNEQNAGYGVLRDIAEKKAAHANYDFSAVAPDAVADLITK